MRNQRLPKKKKQNQVLVSNIFYVHPYLRKIPILTSIFFKGVGSTTNQKAFPYFWTQNPGPGKFFVRPHFFGLTHLPYHGNNKLETNAKKNWFGSCKNASLPKKNIILDISSSKFEGVFFPLHLEESFGGSSDTQLGDLFRPPEKDRVVGPNPFQMAKLKPWLIIDEA